MNTQPSDMNRNIETNVYPSTDAEDKKISSKQQFKRQGKGSRARNVEKYRQRVNQQAQEQATQSALARLNLLTDDESKQLNAVISCVQLTPQKMAVPLSITTRGIGFATALLYDRVMTTWSIESLISIADIHQVYRAALWMMHYKVYCAQQLQSERVSGSALQRIFITERVRGILETVLEVPSLFSVVLNSIGKIETQTSVYHVGYAFEPTNDVDLLEYRTLVVTPDNIRSTLDFLANPNTPVDMIQEYRRFNSIPGLRFNPDGRLANADDVYPLNYGPDDVERDIHAFKNLITRVQPRFFKHTFVKHAWSGKAARAGLWSCARSACNLVSEFQLQRPIAGRTRDASGKPVQEPPAAQALRYHVSKIQSEEVDYWSREETPHDNIVIGLASLVGEECFIHTRYRLGASWTASNNPVRVLSALLDAPR